MRGALPDEWRGVTLVLVLVAATGCSGVASGSGPPATYTIGGTVTGLTGSGLALHNGPDTLGIGSAGRFTFPTAQPSGSAYAVTISAQPSGQTCTVSGGAGTVSDENVSTVLIVCVSPPPATYTVGGTVAGLTGAGLVLQDNGGDNLPIASDGRFTFPTALTRGDRYAVMVLMQPAGQTCAVVAGEGTIGTANVTDVGVTCADNPVPRFTVGGTVNGLAGAGLVLRNDGRDPLAIAGNGPFSFSTSLPTGARYAVTVAGQPSGPSQTCTVSNGSGTVGDANVTGVTVTCVTNSVPMYTVGGTVGGLTGMGLVLRNDGGDDLHVTVDGTFTFATPLTSGSSYVVTIASQPSGQTCTVANGSGTVGSANVTGVTVTCVTNPPPKYSIGGTVNGLTGAGLVLRDNGGDDLAISANGAFAFATPLTTGSSYLVTVASQPPGQSCSVANGSGTVGSANVTSVTVTCVTSTVPRYTVGGTVSGLAGTGLVLRDNGGDDLAVAASGTFTFATALQSGATYAVTVAAKPSGPSQTCTVAGGSGTVGSANVTSVAVTCITDTVPEYTVGGTVSGLTGTGLVLRDNGGDDLAVTASGSFTFATPLTGGSTYAVTVASQPTGQICTVANGSGTVSSANVTTVRVSCAGSRPTLVQHVSSSTNILGRGLVANDFRFTLPNPVGAGNVLVLGISWGSPAGKAATVQDSQGNGWPSSPAVSATDPGGHLASAIFVLPDARPGITTITVSFSAPIDNTVFQYTVSELSGVATSAPVSGTSKGSATQPALSAGTFTPANNDASGGNLVWAYFADASGANASSTAATRFTAGSGFTLLDADIAAPTSSPPFPHASQYALQTTVGPITPAMSVTHDGSGDVYLGVAVALKASPGAGTLPPPGMHIVHVSHLTNEAPDVGAWRLQFPSSGNLIVLTLQEQNLIPVASVSDNLGNSYTLLAPDDTVPQFWYAQGPAVTDSTLELTVNLTGGRGAGVTYLLYDVAGASASSFDGFAFKTQYDDPTGSDVLDSPVITPASAPGLTITATSLGQGPSSGLGPGCPAGAIFDFVYYSGETDLDTMDNADFRAHVFNTDTSTEHWNIAVSNGNTGTNVSSTAAHFR